MPYLGTKSFGWIVGTWITPALHWTFGSFC
jgi:hypothetical protein